MLTINPLEPEILFHLGPVPISTAVITTWGIMVFLVAASWECTRGARLEAGLLQTAIEIVVETVLDQLRDIIGARAERFLPLLGTLFVFLAVANLSAILPGVTAPTSHIETPAALAAIVFLSAHYYGIRSRGLGGYLRRYVRPNPLLAPLNIIAEFTRTFSLMVRLFGNMMSHEIVLAIVVFLAGLLLPIPFLVLGILIGLIQAYIFTVLATVYIGAAAGDVETE